MKRYGMLAWNVGMTSCCLAGFMAYPCEITAGSLAVAWLSTMLLGYCVMMEVLCEQ